MNKPILASAAVLIGIVAQVHSQRWDGAPVTHRDLKPSNVKVFDGPGGRHPVLLDLGLACAEGENDLTVTGAHPGGTPGYVPPWSLSRPLLVRAHGKHWDVHSLAVILVEAITDLEAAGRHMAVPGVSPGPDAPGGRGEP